MIHKQKYFLKIGDYYRDDMGLFKHNDQYELFARK